MFYLIAESTDWLKDGNLNVIMPILCQTGIPQESWPLIEEKGLTRYANSLLVLLKKIEHLLLISELVCRICFN